MEKNNFKYLPKIHFCTYTLLVCGKVKINDWILLEWKTFCLELTFSGSLNTSSYICPHTISLRRTFSLPIGNTCLSWSSLRSAMSTDVLYNQSSHKNTAYVGTIRKQPHDVYHNDAADLKWDAPRANGSVTVEYKLAASLSEFQHPARRGI